MNRLDRGYRNIVKTKDGNYVLIDSRDTFDCGYETMVFRCEENGNVENWLDIDVDRYSTLEEMIDGHTRMIKKWIAQGEKNEKS